MVHVQDARGVVRAQPIPDEALQAELRRAYFELGRDQTRLVAWVEQNHPALSERFAGVQEGALFSDTSIIMMAGILILWFLCAVESARKPGLLAGAVVATLVGGLLAAGLVSVDAQINALHVSISQLLGAALLGSLWLGGVAAFVMPITQLQLYVMVDALKALLPALVALMLMMVVGFCMQLLDSGLDVVRLPQLLPPTFIYALPMVLPAAFLTAVVISFAKFQNDNELIAVRAAGIPLFQIVRPLLGVALLLSGLTAYLQFETVPRANLATGKLGAEAIKSVLLDRITRSPDRIVSYPGGFIQYETFEQGRLQSVVAVQMEGSRPQLLVSASSATVGPDPIERDRINVTMEDILYYGRLQDDESNPPTLSARFIYPLAVETDEVEPTDDKYLTTRGLRTMLQRYRSVLRTAKEYENPEEVYREAREKKRALGSELDELESRLDDLQAKMTRARADRRAAASAARNADQTVQQLEEKIGALKTRQEAISQKMEEMDPLEDPELYKEVASEKDEIDEKVKELLETRRKEQLEVQNQTRERNAAQSTVQSLELRIEQVTAEVSALRARADQAGRKARVADTQRNLLSLLVRVHRRLAWALSIVGFALMGIPLGVMAGSRSIMMAFGISFMLVLFLFYVPLSAGMQWANEGAVHPAVGIWAGNAFMCMIGLALTFHACRR
jgi:lipopolysaccharide export LptBFGC system permease protein LptF